MRVETSDGFDDDPDELANLDLTTAGIGEMLPGVLSPLIWGLGSHLVDNAFRRLLDDLGVLPADQRGGKGLVRHVRGRARDGLQPLAGYGHRATRVGSGRTRGGVLRVTTVGRRAAPTTPGPHGGLRSVRHDLRVLRLRNRTATEAATAVHAVARLADVLPDLVPFGRQELLAYHLRLIDFADRTMAAELGVAADAAATYRRLQIMLAGIWARSKPVAGQTNWSPTPASP